MGGRIYDPTLGRFMQADPIIQAPLDSQSYNRFAYVRNNPMSYTDPSGFSWWTDFRDKILRPVLAIVVSIYMPGYLPAAWGARAQQVLLQVVLPQAKLCRTPISLLSLANN